MKVSTKLTEAVTEGFTSLAPYVVVYRDRADTQKVQTIMMKYGDVTQTRSAKTPVKVAGGFSLTFSMDPARGPNFVRDVQSDVPGARAWAVSGA